MALKRRSSAPLRRTTSLKRRKQETWVTTTAAVLSSSTKLLKQKQLATLRYSGDVAVTSPGAGLPFVHVLSANGIYDPDVIGFGHQPRGFDQLMHLYDHYVVRKATCEVWYLNASATGGMLIGIAARDNATALISRADFMEVQHATFRTCEPTNGGGTSYIRYSVDVNKFLASTDVSELKGSIGAQPAEQVFFHVGLLPINAAHAAGGSCVVKITYEVDFIEPKQPIIS